MTARDAAATGRLTQAQRSAALEALRWMVESVAGHPPIDLVRRAEDRTPLRAAN